MRIDIWSDIVCPWCYLGEKRLDAALTQLGWTDEVDIHWRAYQLDPSAPAEPGDLRKAIDHKYGPGGFDGMVGRLVPLGEEAGITYNFDRAQRVNTFDAHRLVAWAASVDGGSQRALADRLFAAYFTDGENVADPSTLARLAGEAGLDPAEAAEVLAGDNHATAVQADLAAAAELGITGVPNFVLAEALSIPGAQDVETMVSLLVRARERLSDN